MYHRQIRPANAIPAHMCNMQVGSTPSPLCSPQLMYMYGLGDGLSSPGSFSSVHSDLSELAGGCLPTMGTPGSVMDDPMNFAVLDAQGVARMSHPAQVGTPDLNHLQSSMAGLSLPSQWAPIQLPVSASPAPPPAGDSQLPFNMLSASPPNIKRHKRSDTDDSAPLLERSSMERSSMGTSPDSPIPQTATLGNTYTFSPNTQFSAPPSNPIGSLFPSIENNNPLAAGNGGKQAYIDMAALQHSQDPNMLFNDKFMEFLMMSSQPQMLPDQDQQGMQPGTQQQQAVQPGIAPELTMNHASASTTPHF
ncbi:hypothetical protein FBU59_000020 [Linderina macrospora]|uniref:Uncharacterized protein n=1 Tax=Linderina macrospora TaxID=4868 RepID=A0ACC1JHX1_9FUNG|nr:hypothetical protein FBU59_000020 [Linderina macrospora]